MAKLPKLIFKINRTNKILNQNNLNSHANLYLLDIFTYSCMNCLRSWKYLEKLHKTYRKYGLELVIIHPYEWKFEKKKENVARALKELKTGVPAILDPQRKLIKKLGINFWPAQVLVKDGKIVYRHIGEGSYQALEKKLREILSKKAALPKKRVFPQEPICSKIPAVYCGKGKGKQLQHRKGNAQIGLIKIFGRCWQTSEFVQMFPGCLIELDARGKHVFMAARPLGCKESILLCMRGEGSYRKWDKAVIRNPGNYNLSKAIANSGKIRLCVLKGKVAFYSISFS